MQDTTKSSDSGIQPQYVRQDDQEAGQQADAPRKTSAEFKEFLCNSNAIVASARESLSGIPKALRYRVIKQLARSDVSSPSIYEML